MFFMWFSERAYHYTPEEDPERYHELETEIVRERSFWGTPNTYLDRAHGVEWREHVDAEGAAAGGDQPMSREEAYQVLGLEPDAPAEDIKEAHHRLLLKIHPDQGGSTYLAAKINQAKELLLGG